MPNSLSFRLLAITILWTVFALLITGLLLSTYFRQNALRDFDKLLEAHAYNLMGAIDVGDDGILSGTPNLGDPRFLAPASGWYWTVSTAEHPEKPLLHSRSISGEELRVQDITSSPFNAEFRRISHVDREDGGVSQQLEAQLYLGEGNTLYQVLVAGNRSDVEAAVSEFNRTLLLFFSLFGTGTVVATYFVIRVGLKPLQRAAASLHDVREGTSQYLEGNFPIEIEPLAGEINGLIRANQSVVDRARTQVGNLAHALKTPLAVIMNDVRKPTKGTPKLISEQTELMKSQVQAYLDRARIAAQRNTIGTRTDLFPIVQKMLRVMKKLSPQLEFHLTSGSQVVIFKGEQQDFEEILGNLLENAARFAKSAVAVNISSPQEKSNMPEFCLITIEDDGEGLSEQDQKRALKRGIRLDESQPGSGLGLSIVHDIVTEYGGKIELGKSSLGGLSATIFLPIVAGKAKN